MVTAMFRRVAFPAPDRFERRFRRCANPGRPEMQFLFECHPSSHAVSSLSGGVRYDNFDRRFRHSSPVFYCGPPALANIAALLRSVIRNVQAFSNAATPASLLTRTTLVLVRSNVNSGT